MKTLRSVLIYLCVFTLVPATLFAQSSSVTGRIADPQGASVANAELSLVPSATGQRTRTARSNADGSFSIDNVAPGDYTLIVRAPGFTETTQPVSAGAAGNLTVTLKIAGVVEDVTVQGALLGTAATGKTNLPVRDMPMTINTVPGQVIEEQGANDLVAALQNVPGVYAFTNYGIYEGYTFRGFSISFPHWPISCSTACGTKATASTRSSPTSSASKCSKAPRQRCTAAARSAPRST
jgi:hypothetical protein